MRILGLDLGSKTIGVAISDELGMYAHPVDTIKRTSMKNDLEALAGFVRDLGAGLIVIGHPINMDGSKGESAKKAEEFAKRVGAELNMKVELWDERLSTTAVTKAMLEGDLSRAKRKKSVDKLAASYILQGYIDKIKSQGKSSQGFSD